MPPLSAPIICPCTHPNISNTMTRVHTQFWADLNNQVDITKIENEVWMKMSTEAEQGRNATTASANGTASAAHRRTPPTAAGTGNRTIESDSVRPSSKDSSRHDIVSHSKETPVADDEATKDDGSVAADEPNSSTPLSAKFAGILGYEELGHVPTLDEFRSEWPKLRSKPEFTRPTSPEESGVGGGLKGPRWKHQAQGGGQTQQQGPGSVVNKLSKRDEVFRHFKKYYDKDDHSVGRVGDALFSAGVNSTGLLQPDLEVIEAIGRHTEQKQESWSRNRIGEGLLSASGASTGASRRSGGGNQDRQRSSEATPGGAVGRLVQQVPGAGTDGLANVFWDTAPEGEGVNNKHGEDTINHFPPHSARNANRAATGSRRSSGEPFDDRGTLTGSLASISESGRVGRGVRGPHSTKSKGRADGGRAKVSTEGTSPSAELQVSRVIFFF